MDHEWLPQEDMVKKMSATGKKDDTGKKDWDALPLKLLDPVIPAFEAGIKKGYGRHNCVEKFEHPRRRFFSAMMRHAMECQIDPTAWNSKDGCSHASSLAFNAIMFCYHCSTVRPDTREIADQIVSEPIK